MKNKAIALFSWLAALWIARVFLVSLPYKFTGHPDTQHIFGTIGHWMSGVLGEGIGRGFAAWGAIAVGSAELFVSVLLLAPVILFAVGRFVSLPACYGRARVHGLAGIGAAAIMAGALFFHLFTPLGIEVLHQGKNDGGSLFYAACSIFVLGLMMAILNRPFCPGRTTKNRTTD